MYYPSPVHCQSMHYQQECIMGVLKVYQGYVRGVLEVSQWCILR